MKRILSLLFLAGLLSGCGYTPPPTPEEVSVEVAGHAPERTRFRVIEVARFDDDYAYGNRRKIFQIIDIETGREYFGVTGVGISEVGSHSNGKTSSQDER